MYPAALGAHSKVQPWGVWFWAGMEGFVPLSSQGLPCGLASAFSTHYPISEWGKLRPELLRGLGM